MKMMDMLFTGVGVLLVSKVVVLGDIFKFEPLEEEERERTTPCWLLIAVSLHKSMQTHFQF